MCSDSRPELDADFWSFAISTGGSTKSELGSSAAG